MQTLLERIAVEERKNEVTDAQDAWRKKLKLLRGWLGKKRDAEARREIQAVTDWRAAEAAVELLEGEKTSEGKLLWIDVLSKLPTHTAWTALTEYALEDDDDRVRERCITSLEQSGTAPAVRVFLRALADNDKVTADVLVIHASTTDAKTVDPRIAKMSQLSRPPFSAFNTFKVLDQKAVVLEKGRPSGLAVVNGQTLQLKLVEVTQDKRFHVSAGLTNSAGQAVLRTLEVRAAPEEPFFVAGQSYEGGTLVIAITLKK